MSNTKRDRDGAIEHLLRDALAAPASSGAHPTCLSAEIAAAFVDDALSPVERSAAVAHAAGCARCQSLLAAIARTSPPAVSGSWWRLPSAGWLAPLAAAAAAGVIVWAVLPERQRPQQSSRAATGSSLEVRAPVAPAPVSPAASRRFEPEPQKRANRQEAAASKAPAIAATPPPPASNTQGAGQELPAATPANNDVASSPARIADASSAPAPAQPAAPPAAARDATAAMVRVQTAGRQSAALALAEKVTVAAEIVSPDASSRWRILPGGAVQRSFDGGSTWQVQRTGVTVTLTAGASPSPSVCWLVGPGGTVLLSVDGREWRRVAFPETANLISVRATDERTTTITTSDGQMFSTKDGGLTWVR